MLKPIVALALSFLCGAMLMAQTAPPERKVAGNVITSERDPAVRIELPKAAQLCRSRSLGALRHRGL